MSTLPRVTNRVREYEQRRAIALDGQQRAHDLLIEQRLKRNHGDTITGYPAFLIRRALTQLATRTASNGGTTLPTMRKDHHQ